MKQELQYKEKGVETLQEWVACDSGRGAFPVISSCAHLCDAWASVLELHGFPSYAFIYAHFPTILSLRIFPFLKDVHYFKWKY